MGARVGGDEGGAREAEIRRRLRVFWKYSMRLAGLG